MTSRDHRELVTALDPGARRRVRVLVAVGVRLYREGLNELLGRQDGLVVVGMAADPDAAMELAADLQPDVVFLDVAMTGGLALVRRLRHAAPRAAVVATAVAETDVDVCACAEAGVAGLVTRNQSLADAVAVIESVDRGESPCSPRTAAALMRHVAVLSAQRRAPVSSPADGLTRREREIVSLIARGRSNKQIAHELCIELSTVKNHVHNVLEKLGVQGRAEAAARVRSQV